jgi:uncharacterized protein (TIGR02231 family)
VRIHAPKAALMILQARRMIVSLVVGVTLTAASCTRAGAVAPVTKPAVLVTNPAVAAPVAVTDVADAQSQSQALVSRVTRVTVYSDRARLTRQATAAVTIEPTVFAFRSLPGWVDDGSVQIATSAGRIVDVRVDRSFLSTATDASWRRLEDQHRALADKLAAVRDELTILDAQKAQIEAIKVFSLDKFTKDTVIGNVTVQTYGDVVKFISDSLRSTADARRAAQARLDALTPEFEASLRRLDDAKGLMKLEETTVLVTLQAPAATTANVELTYMLPGVTWEPVHELRASTSDPSKVEVLSFAAVSQTSGEDWGGADLAFSTQSTTQSVRIPELEALTLGDTATATRILTSQESSFTRAQVAYEGQNQLWNKLHQVDSAERARSNFEQVYQSNVEYLQIVQGRTVKIFESLEQRGTTAHFVAQRAQSVRGDGHPVRLQIGRGALESTQQLVAAPEQSLNAARTLAMTNDLGQPILPGKVALYLDGNFLGMTDINFITKGEKFSLFLSVADHLKLSRELDRKQSRLVRKTRNQMQVAFVVTVENLGAEVSTFTLADRIPVSENKEIKIDKVAITAGAKPDSQGLLHWDLSLKPGDKREFRISYQVEYPAELVLETQRRKQMDPSMPSPSRSRVEDDIMQLESQF